MVSSFSVKSVQEVLSIIDILTHSSDSSQIVIADQWLQNWIQTEQCWSMCIEICKESVKPVYSMFALNTMTRLLHEHFISLPEEEKVKRIDSLLSLIPLFKNDFNLCRFLGNALAIGSLLSNQDYHMVNSLFNESCCVLLNYLCSLSEECFDERFASLVQVRSFNENRLKYYNVEIIQILESLLQNQTEYSRMIVDVVDLWLSKDLLSPSVLLENSSFLGSIVQLLSQSECLHPVTSVLCYLIESTIPFSLLSDIASYVLTVCPYLHSSSLNPSSLYYFDDQLPSASLTDYIRLVNCIITMGMDEYSQHPECVIHSCWDLFLTLLSYPDPQAITEALDCLDIFLSDASFPTNNTHPIYKQLHYMVIPIELLSNPSMDITSFRANLGRIVVRLSHIVDEEESLEMVLENIKQHDVCQLEGHFFTLCCLCQDMDYLENEDLVQLLFSIEDYFTLPPLRSTLLTLLFRLSHAIATVSSLYFYIFNLLSQFVRIHEETYLQAAKVFRQFANYTSPLFAKNEPFFYSLLQRGVEDVNESSFIMTMEGCCAICKVVPISLQQKWVSEQIAQVAGHSTLSPFVVIARLSTLIHQVPSAVAEADWERVLFSLQNLLPYIQDDDTCVEIWCAAITGISRLRPVWSPLLGLVQQVVDVFCKGGASRLITVICDSYVNAYQLHGDLTPWTPLIEHVTQYILHQAEADPSLVYCCQSITYLFSLYTKCAVLQPSILWQSPLVLPLMHLASTSLCSYHKEVVSSASAFLEMVIVLDTGKTLVVSLLTEIIHQCSNVLMEHSSSHLIYETSHTPLTVLFTLYSHLFQQFLISFESCFTPIHHLSEYQQILSSIRNPCMSVYEFNEVVLKLFNLVKVR